MLSSQGLTTPEQDTRYRLMYGDLRYEEFHRAALRAKMNAPVGSTLCALRIEELWSLARERGVRQRDWSPFMRSLRFDSARTTETAASFPAPPPFTGGLQKALLAAADADAVLKDLSNRVDAPVEVSEADDTAATAASPNAATTPNAAQFHAGLAAALSQLPTPKLVPTPSSAGRAVLSPLAPNAMNATSAALDAKLEATPPAHEATSPSDSIECALEYSKVEVPLVSPAMGPSPTLLHTRAHLAAVLGGLEDELRKSELEATLGPEHAATARREQSKLVAHGPPGWLIALANVFCVPCVAVSPHAEIGGRDF